MRGMFYLLTASMALIMAQGVRATPRAQATARVQATTLKRVMASGHLRCAILATPEDWNKSDLHGPLTALDAEICKAVAVSAIGPAARIDLKAFDTELQAEEALSKGDVDLAVGLSPSATSQWHWHISFGPPIFYDAQAILVRADATAESVQNLAGFKVCVIEGTDNEKVLLAHTVARGIAINALPFQEEGEMDDGMAVRHCDAVSAYLTRLAQLKSEYPKQLGRDRLLPDLLTLAPVVPAYRRDDAQWSMIVDMTIHALVQAEVNGVTQANVGQQSASEDPIVQRLLGVDWAAARALGLSAKDWAARMVGTVGNYGEIYERTVGLGSPLQMPRGLNALYTNGGLMHPMPVE